MTEAEAEDVLARPIEDRPGSDGSRVALGQTESGRYLKVIYVPDPASAKEVMKPTKYPDGWAEARVTRVLAHYEEQSDDEAVAEDEAVYESTTHTAMEVPIEMVPAVRELLAKRRAG